MIGGVNIDSQISYEQGTHYPDVHYLLDGTKKMTKSAVVGLD